VSEPIPWDEARRRVHAAARPLPASEMPLVEAEGATLAAPLVTLTDLPAFPTSSVDGWAVRGAGPWRIVGRVLAGDTARPIGDGEAVEIATGAMVPDGTEQIVRLENASRDGDRISGQGRPQKEWRVPGEEAYKGDELLPAGVTVSPGVLALAAACGYDALRVRPGPRASVLVFGDELLTAGLPTSGRIRDALGPSLPAWLRRAGAVTDRAVTDRAVTDGDRGESQGRQRGSVLVRDTLEAHVRAIAGSDVDVICTTGGTMHGPVDHLHGAVAELGAEYVVNTVRVRPGFPMLVAKLPDGRFVAGLPGNPQSAVVAFVSLVVPLLAGLSGAPLPALRQVTLGAPIPGRGDYTHLALVRLADDGHAYPLAHAGSSMLRGVAQADGFAMIAPGGTGEKGQPVPLVPVPMLNGERP